MGPYWSWVHWDWGSKRTWLGEVWEGFGPKNQKLSCRGSVLADKTWAGLLWGRGDPIGIVYALPLTAPNPHLTYLSFVHSTLLAPDECLFMLVQSCMLSVCVHLLLFAPAVAIPAVMHICWLLVYVHLSCAHLFCLLPVKAKLAFLRQSCTYLCICKILIKQMNS